MAVFTSMSRPECSIKTFGKIPFTQHLYRCETCNFAKNETMCESCAMFCHQNHKLVDLGYIYGYCNCGYGTSRCYCFLMHPVPHDTEIMKNMSRQCALTCAWQKQFDNSYWQCTTCDITNNQMLCYACVKMCHCHHNISINLERYDDYTFCDCLQKHKCKIMPPVDPPEPIPLCTCIASKGEPYTQQGFVCDTCNKGEDYVMCKYCANVCHAGHKVRRVVAGKFACKCGMEKKECLISSPNEPAL